jgi:hypothetical protein
MSRRKRAPIEPDSAPLSPPTPLHRFARIGAPPALIAPIPNESEWARIGANERTAWGNPMIGSTRQPLLPSGYLLDGTPVFDLRDVAAAHGMTYADCRDALREFVCWMYLHKGDMGPLLAGVMHAGDARIHRVQ